MSIWSRHQHGSAEIHFDPVATVPFGVEQHFLLVLYTTSIDWVSFTLFCSSFNFQVHGSDLIFMGLSSVADPDSRELISFELPVLLRCVVPSVLGVPSGVVSIYAIV